jgi:hypothetical protein
MGAVGREFKEVRIGVRSQNPGVRRQRLNSAKRRKGNRAIFGARIALGAKRLITAQ